MYAEMLTAEEVAIINAHNQKVTEENEKRTAKKLNNLKGTKLSRRKGIDTIIVVATLFGMGQVRSTTSVDKLEAKLASQENKREVEHTIEIPVGLTEDEALARAIKEIERREESLVWDAELKTAI
jgi:hypothetical protein